jgi:hypothetical protein
MLIFHNYFILLQILVTFVFLAVTAFTQTWFWRNLMTLLFRFQTGICRMLFGCTNPRMIWSSDLQEKFRISVDKFVIVKFVPFECAFDTFFFTLKAVGFAVCCDQILI